MTRPESAKAFGAATPGDGERNSKELSDQHVEGGPEALDARKMTFAALAECLTEFTFSFRTLLV